MYFRVGAGGAGYEIYVTTSDTSLYGVTLTLSKSGTTVGTAVVDNQGEAKFTVKETGTYTITFTTQGTTYTETVEVSAYEVEIEAGFQFKRWLGLTDLDPDDYASLAAVLADEEAVRQLMTRHASVDYLASFTADDTSVVTILNNDIAAKWITCTAYAEDTLTDAYGALMESIGKYGYGKWVLQGQVPKMTSATAPYGTVSASSEFSSTNAAWKAFNESSTTAGWCPANSDSYGSAYLQYSFINPVKLSGVYVSGCSDESRTVTNAFEFRGSNDGFSTYDVIGTVTVTEASSKRFYGSLNNATTYSSVRMYMVSGSSGISTGHGWHLQFYAYAPLGNVPIMTSNTAPYGEASASSISASGREAFRAFDGLGGSSTWWSAVGSSASSWLQYKFVTPVKVSKIEFMWRNDAYTGTVMPQISNDGTNFTNLLTSAQSIGGVADQKVTIDVPAEKQDYALILRLAFTSTTSGFAAMVRNCQFYGRQMSVSVPKMDSNTSPYGVASADSVYSSYYIYKAFDGDESTAWASTNTTFPHYLQYQFVTPVCIKRVIFKAIIVSSHIGIRDFEVRASNDGFSTYDVLYSGTASDVATPQAFDIDNDNYYMSYRLYVKNTYETASNHCDIAMLQFFGFDYSEKEWDVSHPRHYIYDHGVELENLGSPITYGSPTVEKKPYEILGGTNSGSNGYAFAPESAIDITPYNLMRMIAGDQAMGSTYTSNWGIKLARSYGTGDLTMIALLSISTPISLELGLDVSNVNQSAYPMLAQATSGGSITKMSLTEWWLE